MTTAGVSYTTARKQWTPWLQELLTGGYYHTHR